jgi:hypothetical protein
VRKVPPSPRFEIPCLRRSERREQAAVGLEVNKRRPIKAIEASDQERRPLAFDQTDQRCPDRVRADRRAQRKCPARLTIVGRTLAHEITPRLVQPIEDLAPLETSGSGVSDPVAARR